MSNPMIGHNKGPALGSAPGWQLHCWTRARRNLLPVLPIEVVRLRVARARDLGLDYRTYAGFRAASGRDLVAFLFSTETLRLRPRSLDLPADRAAPLKSLAAAKALLAASDMTPGAALARLAGQGVPFDAAGPAPGALGSWREQREAVRAVLGQLGLPADAVLLVGEGSLQRVWAEAGALAGFLPGERWFGADAA